MSSNTRSFDSSIAINQTADFQTDCIRRTCHNQPLPAMTHQLNEVELLDQNGTRAEYICSCGAEFFVDREDSEIIDTEEVA
ncbi:hypothetical protein DJ69_12770 [Halorubrum persicum]|uniref:Uncharacterized protein n=1 Tax=Halorubrum persicum TaxID=1383844 RepID=A0A2G1WGW1_9EURY|nr:hypothetical protein [Halorubrum persicum]PHQ38221.1 hypothetical protein DJ69_12770 [Halorubrum persicum]